MGRRLSFEIMFKNVYIEVTNVCNFHCSFCYGTVHRGGFMPKENFCVVLDSIKPFTSYIYMHVLGEPLLHPALNEMLGEAFSRGFKVNITTNGSLLARCAEATPNFSGVRQFNISLHDAVENIPQQRWVSYVEELISTAKTLSQHSYVSLRLWNKGTENTDRQIEAFNEMCRLLFNSHFTLNLTAEDMMQRSLVLAPNVFLHNAARFLWPGQKTERADLKRCYALRDHFAVLCDGTVVPCCLDAGGQMALGNIFDTPMDEILNCKLAKEIREGFKQNKAVTEACQHCGFVLDK